MKGVAMRTEDSPTLQRLIDEDAIGQLRQRAGRMAVLGSEDGVPKLDWVEGVARLLGDDRQLEVVEEEARDIWRRGIRHIIWAGMGGSIMAVRVLIELGFCDGSNAEQVTIYPLDSTDPAALNDIVRRIAHAKGLQLSPEGAERRQPDIYPPLLQELFNDVMMIGVAMGMTSEEPITHLQWFADVLQQAQLSSSDHMLVMTLPGSYLDAFAREHQAPSRPLQPDGGTGTGGRMSAPTTRVFLLPAALSLARRSEQRGQLRAMLQQAWDWYDLDSAASNPAEHPFVQLVAALSDASVDGACRLLLSLPVQWVPLVPWIEQLMEESLGKDNKGVVVFGAATLNATAPCFTNKGTLHVHVAAQLPPAQKSDGAQFVVSQPYLSQQEPVETLAALAASFLGWQLTMALYGYLQNITFAGQPAVENYKARARKLRQQTDPLASVSGWSATASRDELTLLAPQGVDLQGTPAEVFAASVIRWIAGAKEQAAYLDITVNGKLPIDVNVVIEHMGFDIANNLLGLPLKLRRAPACYHSTEQSEMDGPRDLLSLRIVARRHEPILFGAYNDTFLNAQAISTWQAMLGQGRSCFLLVLDGPNDTISDRLRQFFEDIRLVISRGG